MHDYIGIDMGTSSVKLLVMDSKGRVLRQHEESYAISNPQKGWREIEPELWYEKTVTGLRILLKGMDKQSIRAIGITGQMHSTVFLDKDGKSVRPVILWNDTRTSKEVVILKEKIADIKHMAYISSIISTGSPAANLFWLHRHEPERFQCIKHFLIGSDYLVFRLTGVYGTDYCEASTSSLFDMKKKRWSRDMCRILGLSSQIFPPVSGSACIAGTLIPDIAEEIGLSSETAVIRGTGDNAAAAFAAKTVFGDEPVISLGTSGVLITNQKELDMLRKGKNILFSTDGERFNWIVQGVVQSSGSSIEWWVKKILDVESFGSLGVEEERMCENELFFYPHLNGDKTLYSDVTLRGAFWGIGMDTTRVDMSIAVLEGICFAFRELSEKMLGNCLRGLHIGVVGGGAKNNLWMQMMADVLQAEIVRLKENIGPVYGAALLAAVGAKDTKLLPEEKQEVFIEKDIFCPAIDKRRYYDEKYKKYLRAYKAFSYIRSGENEHKAVG